MDIRAHIAARAPNQYVKTAPPRAEPELVQYLEQLFPGRLADYDVPRMTHAELAFAAGQQSVISELRELAQQAEKARGLEIKKAIESRMTDV